MKITPEMVEQAKAKLAKIQKAIKASDMPSRNLLEERDNLNFIITGMKFEKSVGLESNCSFFHLQNIPCTLSCQGVVFVDGRFTHPDYSHVYEFFHNGETYVMHGGNNLVGTVEYLKHQPFYLMLEAGEIWPKDYYDAVHSAENYSLTSAMI